MKFGSKFLFAIVFSAALLQIGFASAAEISGNWLFSISNDEAFKVIIRESGGEIKGEVPKYRQTIIGRIHENGFVFGRWGGGLSVPQFFGGRISDDGSNLAGAFCHSHSDCSKTFRAYRE